MANFILIPDMDFTWNPYHRNLSLIVSRLHEIERISQSHINVRSIWMPYGFAIGVVTDFPEISG